MEFRILGPLEVRGEAGPVGLGGPKQRALLAFLLLNANEVVSSDRLIDALWEEEPPATARKSLQLYVSRLRKLLGRECLQTEAAGYVLRVGADELDLERFVRLREQGRLREALSLWRGPALCDFAYQRFAQGEIARLNEARLVCVEEQNERELASGRHAELVGELEALVDQYPLRERLRAQLMLSLYRSGRQAEALEAYRAARRALVEELGIEPGRKLRDLHQAILSQDSELDVVTTDEGSRGPKRADRGFVGRDEELSELRGGLDAALLGRGAVFLIGGSPGVGKSRLVDELARDARERGAEVLWGRCWEAGGAPAYWPWVQILRSLLHKRGGASVAGSLRGAGAPVLAALVPELRGSGVDLVSPSVESEGERFQLFDAVASLLDQSATKQPVVVVLDDLHAADTPSLLLLQFVAGQLARSRLLVIGLYRDDDLRDKPGLTSCLAACARENTTARVRLEGFTLADTAVLIEFINGHRVAEEVSQRIHLETEGNPLFVSEIVRLLSAEGRLEPANGRPSGRLSLPETVTEVIGQRLQRLGAECRRLLSDASILGREFALKELAVLNDIAEGAVLQVLDEAITARVLTSVSAVDRIRFSHALVRETLYEALGPTGRRQAHLRAGEALESLYASNPEPHLAELAHHFFEALPAAEPARAIDYGRRAGDRARQLLGYEEAVRLYELALGALDLEGNGPDDRRCALLVALGDAQARAGDESAARATFLHAAELATRADLPHELARAALGYGGRFVWARAYGDVRLIPLLEHALSLLPADASMLRVKLMARLAGALRDSPTRERRASLSAQAVEIARRLGDPATLAYALAGRYGALMWPENPEERLAVADEIVALAEQAADREREIEGRNYGVIAQMELGRMTEVEAELEIAAQRAEALRQPAQMWMTAAIHAVVALFKGRFDEAEALIGAALRLGERAQRRDAVVSHRLQLFMLWRETKRVAEIDELMGRAVAEFPTRPIFRCALASVRAELGDGGQAQRLLADLAANDFGVINRDNEYLLSLGLLADTARDLGDARAAAVLYDLLVPYAHLNASNADELAAGSVSRPLGVLAATMTRWEDAARHFDVALTQNTAMGARPWVAHSRHDYARMLLQRDNTGDRERGRDLLSAARTDYEAMAMTAWAQRAQEVLAGI